MQHYRSEVYSARSSIGYLLKRAHTLMVDQLAAAVAASEITVTQWLVLMYLRDGLAINASDLCLQLQHDSGALTRVVDKLNYALREFSRTEAEELNRLLSKLIGSLDGSTNESGKPA